MLAVNLPPASRTGKKISQFRARHPAIGAGKQTTLSLKQGYGFVREHGDDKVLVIWAGQQ